MSRSLGATSLTLRSPIYRLPSEMSSRPAIMRSAVLLPQPEGPTSTRNSRSWIVRLRSWITSGFPAYRLYTCSNVTPAISLRLLTNYPAVFVLRVRACPPRLPLDRASQYAAHEVALQAEKDHQGQCHGNERRRRQHFVATAKRVHQPSDLHRHRRERPTADKDQRHQQVVPDPHELEDEQRGERRHRQREQQIEEDAHMPRAVNPRRLQQIGGESTKEIAQEIDREREAECCVRQPDGKIAAGDANRGKDLQDRNQRQLDWND